MEIVASIDFIVIFDAVSLLFLFLFFVTNNDRMLFCELPNHDKANSKVIRRNCHLILLSTTED